MGCGSRWGSGPGLVSGSVFVSSSESGQDLFLGLSWSGGRGPSRVGVNVGVGVGVVVGIRVRVGVANGVGV